MFPAPFVTGGQVLIQSVLDQDILYFSISPLRKIDAAEEDQYG
jgi:hypothetical protein